MIWRHEIVGLLVWSELCQRTLGRALEVSGIHEAAFIHSRVAFILRLDLVERGLLSQLRFWLLYPIVRSVQVFDRFRLVHFLRTDLAGLRVLVLEVPRQPGNTSQCECSSDGRGRRYAHDRSEGVRSRLSAVASASRRVVLIDVVRYARCV